MGNTRKKYVQLDHTTSGCREHRKQMPFLSTGADRERLSPHGALLTEGLYSSALLNIATKYLNKGVKNNTQRRAAEECREESNYADFCSCKQTNWINNVMRLKMLSTAAQQEAGKHFTLILPRQFLATVFQGGCSSFFFFFWKVRCSL